MRRIFLETSFLAIGGGQTKLNALYIDLRPELDPRTDFSKLKELFKIFHKDFLFKEFNPNDANALNDAFYKELLYILGLKEQKINSALLITKSEESNTQGTLYKGISDKLKTAQFESILSLIILWLNRILFLKLIEAKLISFNTKEKEASLKFLSYEKIGSFKKLSYLFFEVLAKPQKSRKEDKDFQHLPYLNSSLFSKKIIENALDISELDDDLELAYFEHTQIKDKYCNKKQGKTKLLEYLFAFLDSFDFGSYGEENTLIKQKELINSSVLGAVFEKLNGYKEGSFYTPSFITTYMCKESLEKIVLDKFNTAFKFEANNLESLKLELREKRKGLKLEELSKFKEQCKALLVSIKICDPAVGSGHFLVSALVSMIKIYDELSLFTQDFYTKSNQDELQILSLNGEFIEYKKPKSLENNKAQLIQEELFNLKKSIIENNLFGVDINPNSCEITKLRLWIELLKHSFYLDTQNAFENLQTLPNIDINIKCGNSLISRFNLESKFSKNLEKQVEIYKQYVKWYKDPKEYELEIEIEKAKLKNQGQEFKSTKEMLEYQIDTIKRIFTNNLKDPKTQEALTKKINEHFKKFGFFPKEEHDWGEISLGLIGIQQSFALEQSKGEAAFESFAKILALKAKLDYNESGKAYENAFEWRFAFPEVLDSNGNFLGFDLIIGNPPYIKEADNKRLFDGTRHLRTYQGKMDIWYHFVGRGFDIVKNKGIVTFIATQNWTTNTGAKNLRNVILKESEILNLVDFGSYMCFDSASIQTMIMEFQKLDSVPQNYQIHYAKIDSKNPTDKHRDAILAKEEFEDNIYLAPTIIPLQMLDKPLTFSDSKQEKVLDKILQNGKMFLKEKEVGAGICPSLDNLFIVKDIAYFSKKEKQYIKEWHTGLSQKYSICKTNKFLIYMSAKNYQADNLDDLPNLKQHFEPYKEILQKAKIQYKTPNKPYFFLHREREERFFIKGNEKIISQVRCEIPTFAYTTENFYGSRALFFIQTDRFDMKFLTGLFNSKLIAFWLKYKGKIQGNLYKIEKEPLLNIPIPKITKANQKIVNEIIALVEEILSLKAQDSTTNTNDLESQIDKLVYQLYNLTDKEIEIIGK